MNKIKKVNLDWRGHETTSLKNLLFNEQSYVSTFLKSYFEIATTKVHKTKNTLPFFLEEGKRAGGGY